MGHCILFNLSFHLELAGLQVFFDKLGSFCVAWSSLGKAQFFMRVEGLRRWGYLQDLRRIEVLERILATERVWVVGRVSGLKGRSWRGFKWVFGRVSES